LEENVIVNAAAVPRPSRRVKLVLSVAVALGIALLASAPNALASAFVPPQLLEAAAADPSAEFRVVVVGTPKKESLRAEHGAGLGRIGHEYSILRGVATTLKGGQLVALARRDSIVSITPDGPVKPSSADTVWPEAIDLAGLGAPAADAPTIAVVDSGLDADRADFAGRVAATVNLNSREPGASGDDNGHGTLVAGIAAGAAAGHEGVSPGAKIVALDVVDADGMAVTSDVIAAADWIYEHRDEYGIRVANFSLHSAYANWGMLDPLSTAVRRLWLTGTVVVAAAGNHGPQQMLYAPASDPFVITVGALDTNGTADPADDFNAPWSSYGPTAEGFAKPELGAPGRYLAGPVAPGATLPTALPERVVEPGYMWMSGTSFAAPVVAGVAAELLARHPEWTPDQVKGALMLTAQPVPAADPLAVGVGQIDAAAAAAVVDPPNPNENLYAFVAPDATGVPALDADAWAAHVSQDASWTSASWTSASWTSASWTSASWTSASWTSASWTSASWTSASWTSASWTSASWTSASWTSASWTSASWTSASWTSASWTSASWTSASWTSASWTS
jgi:serine protease AprX